MRFLHVVGARPNFMKLAPVLNALQSYPDVRQILVHTGQHYDVNMSDIFFTELKIPAPNHNLGVGSGSHSYQTAEIMMRLESVMLAEKPDAVIVYGDVNSTVAAALVCAKNLIPIIHVEAGLRSFDVRMPEEVNRLVTDRLADLLLTPSQDADQNLLNEGIAAEKIHFVGNVMIDTLISLLPLARQQTKPIHDRYILVTLHRPSNVDHPEHLTSIMQALAVIADQVPVIFPVHPRTRRMLEQISFIQPAQMTLMDPVGYIEFLGLQQSAIAVITDSGGVQEETSYLKIPCLTLRENTERPVTVTMGTNRLIGHDMPLLLSSVELILAGKLPSATIPPLWDGQAGQRIAELLKLKFS